MGCGSRAVTACILVPAVMWCSHPKSPNVFFYHTCQTVDVFAVAPPVPCRRFSFQVVLRLVPVSHITNQSALLAGCWALAVAPGCFSQAARLSQRPFSSKRLFQPDNVLIRQLGEFLVHPRFFCRVGIFRRNLRKTFPCRRRSDSLLVPMRTVRSHVRGDGKCVRLCRDVFARIGLGEMGLMSLLQLRPCIVPFSSAKQA